MDVEPLLGSSAPKPKLDENEPAEDVVADDLSIAQAPATAPFHAEDTLVSSLGLVYATLCFLLAVSRFVQPMFTAGHVAQVDLVITILAVIAMIWMLVKHRITTGYRYRSGGIPFVAGTFILLVTHVICLLVTDNSWSGPPVLDRQVGGIMGISFLAGVALIYFFHVNW